MGQKTESAEKQTMLVSYNPANGEIVGEAPMISAQQAQEALDRARAAQKSWQERGLDYRISVLRRFQHLLIDRAEEFCELISKENGKPLQEAAETEVVPLIDLTKYFLDRAGKILSDQKIPLHLMKFRKSFINYRPRGVMLVISPWNYPFTIAGGSIIMGLIAGNAVLHKPASLTPMIALKMRDLMDEAGLDKDVFQVLITPGKVASQIIDMGVNYVNFTGSTQVGLGVAERCGRNLIPCSMELGGKDPMIVMEDADLDYAAGAAVWGGLCNAGQTCASVERVYVQESVYDQFVSRVTERVKALRVGDPSQGEMDMGPMTDANQLEIVANQVQDAIEKGAKVLTGGKRIDGPGQFFEPTVLVDVTEDMEVIKEETFGPLIPIMPFATEDEAIQRANDSIYGLDAYVFTREPERGRRIAQQLEAGTVMVNEVIISHGMPSTPWQGAKKSGIGKVHSDQGLRDLCYPYHINEDVYHPKKSPFWQPYSNAMYAKLLAAIRSVYAEDLGKKWNGVKNLFSGKSGQSPTSPEV